jgi:phosphatidylglycerophosphatase A
MNALVLFIAQGFGIGRMPKAPGTFGTLIGFVWFAVMIALTGVINRGIGTYLVLLIGSIFASVWFCGRAEQILGAKDPGSVVLDEIVAIPVCYLPWLANVLQHSPHHHAFIRDFFNSRAILWSVLIFVLFRVFDIWKPWPIRRLQDLPGGWGVTVDDLVAAVYVALITIPFVS